MRRIFNETIIRIIAIFTMTCDHIGVLLWMVYVDSTSIGYNVGLVLRIIGRLSLPLFIFMLVEGIRHTSNKWKYCGRIAMIGLPITIFEFIVSIVIKDFQLLPPHAFTELILYAVIATLWSGKWWQKLISVLPIGYIIFSFVADFLSFRGVGGLSWFPPLLWADYDIYGFFVFVAFYFAYPIAEAFVKKALINNEMTIEQYRNTDDYRKLTNMVSVTLFIAVNVVFWLLAYFFGNSINSYLYQYHTQSYAVICALFISLYNGKRGYDAKWFRWFNYLYYPVHIVIIFGIFMLLFWM